MILIITKKIDLKCSILYYSIMIFVMDILILVSFEDDLNTNSACF